MDEHILPKIKSITMTCFACPSQWEGKFEDGSDLYIRYRWGFLRVDQNGASVWGKQIGEGLDGVIDLKEVLTITGLELCEGTHENTEGWEYYST